MAKPPIDIDRVVREVLAELGAGPAEGAPGGTGSFSGSADGGELILSARVVTLSEVEGRLESVRRLVVPPQAVITPAVRDELMRKNVSLAYASPAASRATAPVRLVLVAAGSPVDPAPLVGALSNEGIEIQEHRSDCLIAATDQLAGEIARPDTLGLLLTRHTAAGLCLANRLRGVRAVLGTDPRAAAAAAAAVGANLLVVDPAAVSLFQLKQIVTEFCRAGTRPCPEVLQRRLS